MPERPKGVKDFRGNEKTDTHNSFFDLYTFYFFGLHCVVLKTIWYILTLDCKKWLKIPSTQDRGALDRLKRQIAFCTLLEKFSWISFACWKLFFSISSPFLLPWLARGVFFFFMANFSNSWPHQKLGSFENSLSWVDSFHSQNLWVLFFYTVKEIKEFLVELIIGKISLEEVKMARIWPRFLQVFFQTTIQRKVLQTYQSRKTKGLTLTNR